MQLKSKLLKTDESFLSLFIRFCIVSITIFVMFFLISCSSLNYETPSYQPTEEEKANAYYGEFPTEYKKLVEDHMQTILKDPYSAHYRYEIEPQKTFIEATTKEGTIYCYWVPVYINAKNIMGGYTGEKWFAFYIRNNIIIDYLGGD